MANKPDNDIARYAESKDSKTNGANIMGMNHRLTQKYAKPAK
jgi:hypothetical protein